MCGRSTLTINESELEKRFKATFYSDDLERYNPLPNYNAAPTHMMPVITNLDQNHIQIYRWGLIPFWAKDAKIGSTMINARIETIKEKPTYKTNLASKRCLVPMDGFYEWKKENGNKIPFRIQVTDQSVFSCAGLWDSWKNASGEEIYSFTVITLPANDFMMQIHDRMPAILDSNSERAWLEDGVSLNTIDEYIKKYPSELMKMYPVTNQVNNVRNNNPDLIKDLS